MKIEIPIPDGAELIERDAYARGMLSVLSLRRGTIGAIIFVSLAFGFLLGMGVCALQMH